MRILQVYHIYPALFGGASTVVYQLTKELSRRGNKVSVLTTNAYLNARKKYEGKNGIVYLFELFSKMLSKQNIMVANPEFILWVKRGLYVWVKRGLYENMGSRRESMLKRIAGINVLINLKIR